MPRRSPTRSHRSWKRPRPTASPSPDSPAVRDRGPWRRVTRRTRRDSGGVLCCAPKHAARPPPSAEGSPRDPQLSAPCRARRALITRPRLLLLDEPTEGIQPTVVAEIERTILSLAGRGEMSVLLVEQHVGFALRAAQRYCVLEAGRVTSSGEGGGEAEEAVRRALTV